MGIGVGTGIGAALASAAASFAAADAAVAAAIGISLTEVFEITTVVGIGLNVIGTVTGNKTLSKVGMALGIVGGIGSLAGAASSAILSGAAGGFAEGLAPATSGVADAGGAFIDSGAFDAASGAAASGGGFAEGLSPATAGTLGGAVDNAGFDASFGGLTGSPVDATGATLDGQNTIGFLDNLDKAPTDLITANTTAEDTGQLPSQINSNTHLIDTPPEPPGNIGTTDPVTGANLGSPGGQAASDASNPATYGQTSTFETGNASGANAGTGSAEANALDSAKASKGIFGQLLDFANNNKTVTAGIIQAGGSLLKGLTNQLTPAQIAYYNANAANNQAQANLTAQQTANLAMPKATAANAPITGAPAPLIAPRPVTPNVAGAAQLPGLINTPRLAPVTGATA